MSSHEPIHLDEDGVEDELRDFDPTKEGGGGPCKHCGARMDPWVYVTYCAPCSYDFLPYLRQALVNTRQRADATQIDVARLAGVDSSQISRFEAAEAGWPNDPDRYVNAYAQVAEIDPVSIWRRAVMLMEHDLAQHTNH